MEKKTVAIIGGGITGLATAFYIQKEAKEKNLPIKIRLIEASPRLGGVIQTVKKDGFIIERGPDSILERKKSALKLIEDVGLADKVVHNTAGKSYILVNGKLHSIPEGSFMGIPTKVSPFVFSRLFSPLGKVRAACDFILPKGKPQADQSLGRFFRRRLGDEVVENLIEPLLSGIYAGNIDELSLMSLFPNFYQIEQEHRSLVIGLNKTIPTPPKNVQKQPTRKGMFISLTTGLEELVRRVEESLETGTVSKGAGVDRVSREGDGYSIFLTNGEVEKVDSIVLAVNHFQTKKILADYALISALNEMSSVSVANVAMAFPKSAIKQDIDSSGFVVSRNSDFQITACTWTHKKWPNTTPEGMALLRCYVGKPDDQQVVDLNDEEIIEIALNDLNKTMNITEKPIFHVVTRWKKTMPQYNVGHKERMERLKKSLSEELPGVFLAGSSFEGVGIPDCIDQGHAAVKKVMDYLS
ncbi:protoporphyrinogen oxidase [Pseudoneobacillus sp. C159]